MWVPHAAENGESDELEGATSSNLQRTRLDWWWHTPLSIRTHRQTDSLYGQPAVAVKREWQPSWVPDQHYNSDDHETDLSNLKVKELQQKDNSSVRWSELEKQAELKGTTGPPIFDDDDDDFDIRSAETLY